MRPLALAIFALVLVLVLVLPSGCRHFVRDRNPSCALCHGAGMYKCANCETTGQLSCPRCTTGRTGDVSMLETLSSLASLSVNGPGPGRARCSACDGSGRVVVGVGTPDSHSERCANCGGNGVLDCSKCSGSGSISCPTCGGKGRIDCGEWVKSDEFSCPACERLISRDMMFCPGCGKKQAPPPAEKP